MGQIIKTKAVGDKIVYQIELSENEALQLQNHVKKVHMFAGDLCIHGGKLIERGANGGAKYISVPSTLKSRRKPRYSQISYQKVELDDKVFFVCTASKDLLFD